MSTLSRLSLACAVAAFAVGCEEVDPPASDAGGGGGGSCAVTLCPVDTVCDDITGVAECIPLPSCDDITCGSGEVCELQPVQCIRAPCPAQPACVPATGGGVACGNSICGAGLECCNASCGWCVEPGRACIQIACD